MEDILDAQEPKDAPSGPQPPWRISRENRGVPSFRYAEMVVVAMQAGTGDDPETYKGAMRLLDATKWKEACAAKVSSLVENEVFERVDGPVHKTVVTCKWVFKKKREVDG